MENTLLSIGIIFRNDIRCIERCLKSLVPLREAIPCQLVMADTGSTDGSRAVAERYADILIDFPWINDFAAARNAVLDQCTGKWYLTVDTDEWLDEDFSQLVTFLHNDEARHSDEARIIQRNFMDKDLEEYTDFFAARMGRRRGGKLRYFDPIHEYLSYTDRPFSSTTALSKVILNHDGYLEMTPGAIVAKQKRNMVLLREELAKEPDNLRTLKHCMDSAEDKAECHKFVRMSMETARKQAVTPFHAAIYQTCSIFYHGEKDLDSLKDCLEEWRMQMPDSALYRVDGEYLYASLEYQKKRYEEALAHLRSYEEGLADVDSGADLAHLDRLSAMYKFAFPSVRQRACAMRFHCLCKLERFEEVDQLLRDTKLLEMKPAQIGVLVLKVLEFWPHLKQASPFLRAVWDRAASDLAHGESGKKYQACREWADDLAAMFKEYWQKHGREALEQLLDMGERTPGKSARILRSDAPEAIAQEWEGVTEWTQMFPEAYLHTMELRLPLPAAFYQQPSEKMAQLATALARKPVLPRTALDWLTHSAPPETPGELTWQLDLVTAALRAWNWKGEEAVGEGLCALYAGLSATYLDNIYNPELLNEEDIQVLPGMQRYAWHVRQALDAWEQGDELGYVRGLKAGLDAAPAMKNMVDFLLEHKPKTAAQRQLEELAGQVQSILAQYAPDDPAVAALKQSPAYQKVAHLLVQQVTSVAVPQTLDNTPVSPTALEEALAGNWEEITASIRENMARNGEKNAEERLKYWEKYPMWGKTEDEVVNNLSAALSAHGTDFRWLFDRLGDEQSRRILTAVVRSWRFFELEPLKAVKERQYDDYFDRSLLYCDENEVVADLGAYTGDTFLSYVKNYGSMAYRRYYCYEITKNSFETLTKVTEAYPRVVLRRKGAGDGPGTMALDVGADASANTLSAGEGTSTETVEIVALDDDITEPLTLIKMDIEGAEQSALAGCARHIREDRPKLALSVYHNFEDLWKLPRIVEKMAPGYRFYLRYHGGDLWPSEITLLGIPD